MNRGILAMAAAVAGVIGASRAPAAVKYWDGGDSNDNNWSSADNWTPNSNGSGTSGDSAPATGDDLVFYSSASSNRITTNVVNEDFTIGSLTFGNSRTGNVIINDQSNDELTINGKANYTASAVNSGDSTNLGTVGIFIQSGFGAVTIDAPLILGTNAQKWIHNSANLFTVNGSINLNSKVLTLDGTGTYYFNGRLTNGAGLTKNNSGDLILSSSSASASSIGTISITAGRLFAFNQNSIGTSTINVSGTGGLHFSAGNLTPSNNTLTFTSGTTLANRSGTLNLGANLTLPSTGTMIFNNDDQATTAISISGNRALTGPITYQVGGSHVTVGDVTFSGNLTGMGGLTKTGSGKLIFSGNGNSYSGGTNINAGTLALTGSGVLPAGTTTITGGATFDVSALSTFTLANTQTLAGTGSANLGAKTFTVNGTLAPGQASGVGALSITGNVAYGGTGITQIALGTAGGSHTAPGTSDRIAVTGTLALGGTLSLVNNAGANGQGSMGAGSYRIATYSSGTASGAFSTITGAGPYHALVSTSASPREVYLDLYNYAAASRTPDTLTFGNYHVGDTVPTQAISLTNTAVPGSFTEGLDATLSSGAGITTAGSVNNLAAGGTNATGLQVGINTATAGAKAGTVTLNLASHAVNGSTTALASQTVSVLGGNVYNLAAADTIPNPTSLGAVRVGGTFSDTALTVRNAAPAGGFTEGLDASLAATGGLATHNGGSVSNLVGQTTDNSSLVVGLGGSAHTGSAGLKSGTVTVNLASNGSNSGLASTNLTAQTVTVQGGVYDYANPTYSGGNLDFGNTRIGGTRNLAISNTIISNASYQDDLNISATTGNANVSATGFSGLHAGGAAQNLVFTAIKAGNLGASVNIQRDSVALAGTGLSGLTTHDNGGVSLSGAAYDYANPIYTGGTLAFGNVRVGATLAAKTVEIQNAAITSAAYQDSLTADVSTNNARVSASGFGNLAAGGSGELVFTPDTSQAGSLAANVNLTLTSNPLAGTGLDSKNITGTPTITLTGNVVGYAATNYTGQTLDFGNVHTGATALRNVTITNTAAAGSDSLQATLSGAPSGVTVSGSPANIAPGASSSGLTVSLNTTSAGGRSGTVNVSLVSKGSAQGLDDLLLGTPTISVIGNVYSGQGVWNSTSSGAYNDFSNWTAAGGVPGIDGALSANDTATFGSSAGPLTISLNGTSASLSAITFNSANRYTIAQGSGGTLNLSAASTTINVTGTHEIAAPLGGSGGLNKTGTGTLVLSRASAYGGATTISAGALELSSLSYLDDSNLSFAGGVLQANGTFTRATNTSAGGVQWDSSGGFAAVDGQLTVRLGNGTAAETWNSGDFVPDGQALVFGSTSADSLVDFQNAINMGTGFLASGVREFRVVDNPNSSTDYARISGAITDGALSGYGINKTGDGILELSGTNNYGGLSAGTTTVTAGTLLITGSTTGDGAATVNSGARLGGTGTLVSATTIAAGGTLAPGRSIGTFTNSGNLTINGNFEAELGTAGSTAASGVSDRQVVTGNVTLTSGTLRLLDNADANGQGSAGPGAYRVLTYSGTRTGTFASVVNPMSATLHHKLVYGASSNGTLDVEMYGLAQANTLPTNINLGIIHVGEEFTAQSLTITNSAATPAAFTEGLTATALAGSGATAVGSVSNLAAGSSSTAISLGLSAAGGAGAKGGSVQVAFASDKTRSGWAADTALGTQTITITGAVYNYAAVGLNSTAINFGTNRAEELIVSNIGGSADFTDLLNGQFILSGDGFAMSAADFAGLAGGSANSFNVWFDDTGKTNGTYYGTITLAATSTVGASSKDLGVTMIQLEAVVIPEPSAALTAMASLGTAGLLRRRRRTAKVA